MGFFFFFALMFHREVKCWLHFTFTVQFCLPPGMKSPGKMKADWSSGTISVCCHVSVTDWINSLTRVLSRVVGRCSRMRPRCLYDSGTYTTHVWLTQFQTHLIDNLKGRRWYNGHVSAVKTRKTRLHFRRISALIRTVQNHHRARRRDAHCDGRLSVHFSFLYTKSHSSRSRDTTTTTTTTTTAAAQIKTQLLHHHHVVGWWCRAAHTAPQICSQRQMVCFFKKTFNQRRDDRSKWLKIVNRELVVWWHQVQNHDLQFWLWCQWCGCQTDLWGCRVGAARSSGTARMDRLRRPAAGSAGAAWSRSAAAPPSSPTAAVTPSEPSPPPATGWIPDGHRLPLLSPLLPRRHPRPACHQSGRLAKGRRAACWCRGTRRPEVWARRGWASRRCCPGRFAGRCGRARRCRRCHNRETGSWRGGRPSGVTSGRTPVRRTGEKCARNDHLFNPATSQ